MTIVDPVPTGQRPIVVVDPFSSGAELAPAFANRGHPAIAVLSAEGAGDIYSAGMRREDFLDCLLDGPELVSRLMPDRPLCALPGTESGVPVADRLAAAFTPDKLNAPELSVARRHKGHMQQAIADAGLPSLRTIHTSSAEAVADWLRDHDLLDSALIVKPADSAGSDQVHRVPRGGDWRAVFDHVLSTPTKLLNRPPEAVVVQEFASGIEFAVDTVSCDGRHVLTNIIEYRKIHTTIFDYTEWVRFDPDRHGELVDYTRSVLDTLGIRWGAAHTEIMLTARGPRLIETGARMCGGPASTLCRVNTGSSQVERLVEVYLDGGIRTGDYEFQATVVPVFLAAPRSGILHNREILDSLSELPTHQRTFVWKSNGDRVVQTVDFVSNLGIIALAGDREAVFTDYQRVREVEKLLRIE